MTALTINNLSRNFGGLQAVSNVSLTVEVGERRLMIGPNGAGKTTLFNMLAGALAASNGSIALFGRDITQVPAYVRARMGIARTFQITNLFPRLTVRENLLLALLASENEMRPLHQSVSANHSLMHHANRLLDEWDLGVIAGKHAKDIAYGQKRQVDLVLALASRPKILLLDEPTAGLSAAEVVRVVGMISGLPRNITILMIEHDMDVAFELADRVSVLHQGHLIAEGDVEAIRNHPQVREIYLGVDDE